MCAFCNSLNICMSICRAIVIEYYNTTLISTRRILMDGNRIMGRY